MAEFQEKNRQKHTGTSAKCKLEQNYKLAYLASNIPSYSASCFMKPAFG